MANWKQAFSMSKEEVAAATPPGTTLLVEHDAQQGDHVQLIPRPSGSGQDPLNVSTIPSLLVLWTDWPPVACLAQVHCPDQHVLVRLCCKLRLGGRCAGHSHTTVPAGRFSGADPWTARATAVQ